MLNNRLVYLLCKMLWRQLEAVMVQMLSLPGCNVLFCSWPCKQKALPGQSQRGNTLEPGSQRLHASADLNPLHKQINGVLDTMLFWWRAYVKAIASPHARSCNITRLFCDGSSCPRGMVAHRARHAWPGPAAEGLEGCLASSVYIGCCGRSTRQVLLSCAGVDDGKCTAFLGFHKVIAYEYLQAAGKAAASCFFQSRHYCS